MWPARVGAPKQGLRICKGCGTAAFCSSCRGDLWHSEDAIHEHVYGAQVTGSLLWHYRLDARSARCWPNCHLASDTTRCMKEGLLVCRGCALRLQACQDHARSQGIEEHDRWQQLVCCALSISRLLRLLHSISSEDACLCLSTLYSCYHSEVAENPNLLHVPSLLWPCWTISLSFVRHQRTCPWCRASIQVFAARWDVRTFQAIHKLLLQLCMHVPL